MMVVTIEETDSQLSASLPEVLLSGHYESQGVVASYDIHPNSQRFIMIKPVEELVPAQINVVLNWSEELRKKIPTGGGR